MLNALLVPPLIDLDHLLQLHTKFYNYPRVFLKLRPNHERDDIGKPVSRCIVYAFC